MSTTSTRETIALLGSVLVKAVPFWYMGVRGAVAELAERESNVSELMALTGASYEACSATVAEYAKGELHPDWGRFRQATQDALIAYLSGNPDPANALVTDERTKK